jgi:hypothetical protein
MELSKDKLILLKRRQRFERVSRAYLPGLLLRHKRTGDTWMMGFPHRGDFWIMRACPAARILVSCSGLEKNYELVPAAPAPTPLTCDFRAELRNCAAHIVTETAVS